MRIKSYIHQLTTPFLCLILFCTCKKEVKNIDSFTSFGRAYPMAGNQNIAGAIKTPDDGYLLWGYTDAGVQGKQDGFLMRLDKDYKQLWYKTYGGFSNDYFESATFDNDGNILAGGTSTSFGASLDTNSYIANPCIYAVYVSGEGALLWEKSYQGNAGAKHYLNIKNYGNTLSKVLLLPDQNIALVGSSNNYTLPNGTNGILVLPNAFIQCINKQGDTLWQSHYNYYDTITPSTTNPLNYMASNAVLSPDGNIEMLMVLPPGSGAENFPMSLVKISPNSTSGHNNYISRKLITGYSHGAIYPEIIEKPFFSMQLLNQSSENYFLGVQTDMILTGSDGTMLKRVKINENSVIQDMVISNGSAWFAGNQSLIKTDLNGTITWSNTAYAKLKIDKVKGIFIEKDASISVFCSYTNAVGEKDLALLRLNENGQLILK